ncbi:DUF4190 domain-containing protein [Cryobacterium sp. TMT1-21]|uniref:DUF4190 domain-containing protein n=1 Tax=unclassified Cryobacterium TaxID=2649013 RepID=UPI00106B9B90|nr:MULTISPECIES: DUF4190 domain-containing protein [unclassified Cryobacterium]TFD17906.1 DUF4190 domain-containing protein [Cryobacterium sp. TMT1-21]TFD35793.1 DUF4190 domain-containing protein [Cryobacterium sp. TMT2-10]
MLQKRARTTAIAGLVISVVAIILSVIMAVVYIAGFAAAVADSVSTKPVAEAPAADAPAADAPAADSAAVGTWENPAPLGTTVVVKNAGVPAWEVTLNASTLDANAAMAAENQFNDAPAAGSQWAMVPVTVKYVGTETGNPAFDLTFSFVSAAGTTHQVFDHIAMGPNELSATNDLYPGATATGNVVIEVPSADVAIGTWTVKSIFGEDFFYAAQ